MTALAQNYASLRGWDFTLSRRSRLYLRELIYNDISEQEPMPELHTEDDVERLIFEASVEQLADWISEETKEAVVNFRIWLLDRGIA